MKYILAVIMLNTFIFSKDIEISNAFIRLAPPFAKVTAGFLKIKSNYNKNIKIIKAKSSFAEATELHDMKIENSKMSMFALDFVKIPPRGNVEFKKGSKHIMFIGLKDKLKDGEIKKVKLFLDNGKNINIDMKVRKF